VVILVKRMNPDIYIHAHFKNRLLILFFSPMIVVMRKIDLRYERLNTDHLSALNSLQSSLLVKFISLLGVFWGSHNFISIQGTPSISRSLRAVLNLNHSGNQIIAKASNDCNTLRNYGTVSRSDVLSQYHDYRSHIRIHYHSPQSVKRVEWTW